MHFRFKFGGISDTAYEWYNGDIAGGEAAAELAMAALFGGAGAKAVKFGFSSFGEARGLYKEWGVGTFDIVGQNIRHHAKERGGGNYAKYMRQASNFNKRGSQKKNLDGGAIRYNRPNGEFLIQRDGLTVTYGWNK